MVEVKNNSKKPLVSIIITVKNAEENLMDCLKSVGKQTLENLEIVAVYAESEDKTLELLKKYQKKDSRLKIFYQDRPGIGAAKNCGIENATGEFITFLDGDDYYLDETALEKMYKGAKEHNVKVCGGLRSTLNIDGTINEHPLHRTFLIGFPNGRFFHYRDVQYDYHFHSYLYDREMIINSDARFAETKVYDDTHFFIRAMVAAKDFYVVPVELYCYRCHESYAWDSKKCYEALVSLMDELKYAKNQHLYMTYYFAMQRINYEYGPQFENHIRKGNLNLLSLLLEAQNIVDDEILSNVVRRMPTSCIIDPMNFPNYGLKTMIINGEDKYFLTPLYNILNPAGALNIFEYQKALESVYNSKTFRTGKAILWLPKKIFRPQR